MISINFLFQISLEFFYFIVACLVKVSFLSELENFLLLIIVTNRLSYFDNFNLENFVLFVYNVIYYYSFFKLIFYKD